MAIIHDEPGTDAPNGHIAILGHDGIDAQVSRVAFTMRQLFASFDVGFKEVALASRFGSNHAMD